MPARPTMGSCFRCPARCRRRGPVVGPARLPSGQRAGFHPGAGARPCCCSTHHSPRLWPAQDLPSPSARWSPAWSRSNPFLRFQWPSPSRGVGAGPIGSRWPWIWQRASGPLRSPKSPVKPNPPRGPTSESRMIWAGRPVSRGISRSAHRAAGSLFAQHLAQVAFDSAAECIHGHVVHAALEGILARVSNALHREEHPGAGGPEATTQRARAASTIVAMRTGAPGPVCALPLAMQQPRADHLRGG